MNGISMGRVKGSWVVAVLLSLAAACSSGPGRLPVVPPTTTTSTSHATAAPPTSTTAAEQPAVRPIGNVSVGIAAQALVLAGNDIYAAGEAPAVAGPYAVVRVDVAGLAARATASLSGRPLGASVSNGSLYVLSATGESADGVLSRLDATTLIDRGHVAIAGPGSALVARPEGLYVQAADKLERRDPTTLAVTGSLPLPIGQRATSMAADPRTAVLWVVLTGDAVPSDLVEIDLQEFRVLRTRTDLPAVAGGSVSATVDGAWLGAATGLQSAATLVRAADGVTVGHLETANPNFASYTVSGTRLWFSGFKRVACAALSGGPVLGSSDFDAQGGALGADTGHVYVGVGTLIRVPCLSG